ncbi:hypothetical protein JR316_0004962 [Psilocybe cubensis]|uniref:Asl1-like glycosyl hydrolase catalytic domain-containing protein n=2 Tax=Psilocybe cubensis TaxID=181762 RepID=A0A8H8CK42_PSICU|nr:hypothetical protein JR316_0004962 [Psilocybe cubensis]KAH9482862.1 hypothetical protein JR316_0004962 [Psilocybe cubensis]
MASKLINLIALSSLVILACSLGPAPVNALSIDTSPNHHARHLGHHQLIAKKKRADSRRCKPRPSSSLVKPSSTKAAVPSSSVKPAVVTPAPAPTTKAAAPPKTTQAPAPPPPSTNAGAKVGIAWPMGDDPSLKNFKTNKVSFLYTWSPNKPANADALGFTFMPMFWGPKDIANWQRLVKPGYARFALGFNEPDHAGQAALDPGYGASLWKQYIEPLKNNGYTLISPAVTSGSGGIPWLQSFFGACGGGCTVHAMALHWYGTNPQDFIKYVENFHNVFQRDIYVTEFACQNFSGGAQCSQQQVQTFMDTVTGWMDATSYIKGYMAFGVMHDMSGVNPLNQLMAGNGLPTPLGYDYLN